MKMRMVAVPFWEYSAIEAGNSYHGAYGHSLTYQHMDSNAAQVVVNRGQGRWTTVRAWLLASWQTRYSIRRYAVAAMISIYLPHAATDATYESYS